jgi:hypothetical protein
MPINDNKPLRDQIPHGKHLTFVDTMRVKFQPVEEQEEYLRKKALERKQEAEAAARRGEG